MSVLKNVIKNVSIKKKLIFLGMFTASVSIIITCMVYLLLYIIEERRNTISEMNLVTKILSDDISTSIFYRQSELVADTLSFLKVRDVIELACVYTSDGKEFAKFARDEDNGLDCASLPKTLRKYEFVYIKGQNYLLINNDIIFDGSRSGYIYMLSNLYKINEKIKIFVFYAIGIAIVVMLISYLISVYLQVFISKPITNLSELAFQVKQGNYSLRSRYNSGDELGKLTDAFNSMLIEIEDNRENLERKVIERTSDLEKALLVKSEFLSNMSHEIRTPIHGIMNYAEFLVEDWMGLSELERFNFANKLYKNSHRLLSLVNNLLDFAKLDASKMEFDIKSNDLAIVVDSVIQECEPLYVGKKDLKVEFVKNEQINNIAQFDIERITQVVRNILSNSIKFTENGVIRLSIENCLMKLDNKKDKVKSIRLIIEDEGIGIPENELEYIFQKYNQSAKTKSGSGGTGLGLAISSEIIRNHSGKIWGENNSGKKGAKFIFEIPIVHVALVE